MKRKFKSSKSNVVLFLILFSMVHMNYFLGQDFGFSLEAKTSGSLGFIQNSSIAFENQSIALIACGGVGGTMMYNEKIGVSIDLLVGKHGARYRDLSSLTAETYGSQISMVHTQIPILFKVNSESGYIAIGPQLNFIGTANYSASDPMLFDQSVGEFYKNASWSGVLESCYYRSLGRRSLVSLITGLRVNYGFSDIEGVNPQGISYALLPDKSKSVLLSIGIIIGLSYELN